MIITLRGVYEDKTDWNTLTQPGWDLNPRAIERPDWGGQIAEIDGKPVGAHFAFMNGLPESGGVPRLEWVMPTSGLSRPVLLALHEYGILLVKEMGYESSEMILCPASPNTAAIEIAGFQTDPANRLRGGTEIEVVGAVARRPPVYIIVTDLKRACYPTQLLDDMKQERRILDIPEYAAYLRKKLEEGR